ncbi:(2Fe-2S)-binding protein [Paenibacillus sp. GCM10023248]|uniref:(2Fe-2S)-binding protein n=1 Tax=Bacillales TaxID=1385 RepID=UPI00237967A8|nr:MULTISPECIES: (2Fe-2S)-binding protein [Bacillales]MDD9266114.1 (2Fe-2S)-binding protein [Paenibacillus sp. MAHUQ-63]MDR6878290.1 ferric iron reductase protein FhuF [Bacillus sp. 3255]
MSSSIQQAIAEQFGVTTEFHPDPLYAIAGSRLMTECGMQELIDAYSPLMKALEPAAAGAYFIGRLSVLNMAMHYMLTQDELIDLAPELWTLQIYMHDKGYVEFRYALHEIRPLEGPADGERSAWREERLSHWYGTHLRPIVETTAQAVDMDLLHLWKLFPIRLRYMFDQLKEKAASEQERLRLEEEWAFVSQQLDGQVFGRARNPLDVKFVTIDYPGAPGEPDKQMRMKTACCMFYRTDGGYKCYTCPRMKPAEREERKVQIREKLAQEAAVQAAAR